MDFIELEVLDVEVSQSPSEAFGLIVREKGGTKEMTIVIGLQEARTIVLLLNKIQTRRPSTHDLFKNFMKEAGYGLTGALIYRYEEGVFYANLNLENENNGIIRLDARTSDAISIALLMNAPIVITKEIFEKLALEPRKEEVKIEDFTPDIDLQPEELEVYIENKLQEMPSEELERLLQGAIDSEDFELASKIHTEINNRKS